MEASRFCHGISAVIRVLPVIVLLTLANAPVGAATQHFDKQISYIETPSSASDCLYFQLTGVGTADAVVSGNPWFAVPRTHNGFREIYAMLISGKIAGVPVTVRTTGTVAGGACGPYALVDEVLLAP